MLIIGWHGQTLFVRACLVIHNNTKITQDVACYCPPAGGGLRGWNGTGGIV